MAFDSVFPLYQDWEVSQLGDVCKRGGGNVQTGPFGSQLHASDYVAEGIPSVMPQNIGDNRILDSGIARITEADAQRLSKYRLLEGDIIYSRRGDVERRALVRESEEGWLCGTGCLRIRFGEGVVHPEYAAHYLGHPAVREWIVRHAHGATMPNLNTTILSELPFVLPPWEVQVFIGDAIELYDQKVDLNRRINQTLEAMAQAIFKSWFVDFDPVKAKIAAIEQGQDALRAAMRAISGKTDAELDQMPREHHDQLAATAALFPDAMEESELGGIPTGWKAGTLAEICRLNPESWSAKTLPNTVIYVDLANTKNGEISELQVVSEKDIPSRARRILRSGDTIIGTVRPGNRSFALVGKEGLTGSTGFAVLRPIAQEWLEFVYLVATSGSNIDRLTHLADGGAYPAVRPEVVVQGNIVIPDRMLAQAFHQHVQPFWVNILANRESTETLAKLRDVLLPELLSGNIYIQHEEDR